MTPNPNAVVRSTGTAPDASATPPGTAAADVLLRILAGTGMTALTTGALWVSYWHVYDFVRHYGVDGTSAYIVAGTVDGLILMAGIGIAVARRQHQPAPPIARAALILGLAATGTANAWSGAAHGPIGIAVGLWVPLVLEISYQLLMWVLRSGTPAEPAREEAPASAPAATAADEPAPAPAQDVTPAAEVPRQARPARSTRRRSGAGERDRRAAREMIRAAFVEGRRVTGKEVGDRYSRSERWGRNQITACRNKKKEPAVPRAEEVLVPA